jgi:hypothetical protein
VKLHVTDVLPVRPNWVALTVQSNLVAAPLALARSQARSAVNGLLRLPEATLVIAPVFLTLVLPSFHTVKFSVTVPPSGSETVAYSLIAVSPMVCPVHGVDGEVCRLVGWLGAWSYSMVIFGVAASQRFQPVCDV